MIAIAKKLNRLGDQFISQYGVKDFHKFSSELLSKSNLASHFDYQNLIESSFKNSSIQNFKNLEFSDLPVTISRGEYCFIDVYFWRRRPTVIHNHHFTGAFMCLLGQNVDLEFSFKKTQKLGRYHDLGTLELKNSRKLLPGDVASIAFMDRFIHQNHHQADLTVNLCFRTPQTAKKSLSNYLFSGLRYEKNPELLGRVGRLMRFLNLQDFDPGTVKITNDDAINFLIQTFDTESNNPRLLKLRKTLNQRMKSELGINIPELMKSHERTFSKIEDDYE